MKAHCARPSRWEGCAVGRSPTGNHLIAVSYCNRLETDIIIAWCDGDVAKRFGVQTDLPTAFDATVVHLTFTGVTIGVSRVGGARETLVHIDSPQHSVHLIGIGHLVGLAGLLVDVITRLSYTICVHPVISP